MAKRDYYEVLGLERDASESAIKGAYRKKALKYHPDRNPGDAAAEEQFKEASEAYEVLSDPDKKAAYDRYGHAGVEGNFGSGGFQWTDFTHAGDFEDVFGDIFESFFGGRRSRGGSVKPKGRDLKIKVALTLEEIATGVEKNIALTRLQRCKSCEGTGAASGAGRKACSTCGGRGQVQQMARTLFGPSMTIVTCPTCEGEGQIVSNPCPECRGEGRERGQTTLPVRIPAGVQEGNYIPLRGQGEVGPRGGPAGDCLVFIEEKEHDYFYPRWRPRYLPIARGFWPSCTRRGGRSSDLVRQGPVEDPRWHSIRARLPHGRPGHPGCQWPRGRRPASRGRLVDARGAQPTRARTVRRAS